MLLKKRKKSDGNYPVHGWKKVWQWLKQIILFPIRQPIWTFVILLILFLAPTFRGVKPVNVHKWYGSQIVNIYNKILVWWGVREPEVTPGEFKFHPEEVVQEPVKPSEFNIPDLNDQEAPNILDVLRGDQEETEEENTEEQNIEEMEGEGKKEEIVNQPVETTIKDTVLETSEPLEIIEEQELVVEEQPLKAEKVTKKGPYSYPKSKKIKYLNYLASPQEIAGEAKVYNCNEIEVNNVYVMLYGVYVHPYTAQGEKASQYLKDWIEGKQIKCGIVAYTDQNIATGICYFKDTNINRDLILKGYTKNIAL